MCAIVIRSGETLRGGRAVGRPWRSVVRWCASIAKDSGAWKSKPTAVFWTAYQFAEVVDAERWEKPSNWRWAPNWRKNEFAGENGENWRKFRWNISPLTTNKTEKEAKKTAKKAASAEVENDDDLRMKHLKAKKGFPGLRAAKSLNNIKLPSLHLRLPKFRIPKRKNNKKSETKTVMSDDQESDGPEWVKRIKGKNYLTITSDIYFTHISRMAPLPFLPYTVFGQKPVKFD